MGQIEKSMNTIPLPLKCLAMLILEFDLGASASEGELPGRVTGSPRADNCCDYTVDSSVVSPYNYLRASKQKTFAVDINIDKRRKENG